jgi:PBP1b-binding outer membrane lipoprotein LpoB
MKKLVIITLMISLVIISGCIPMAQEPTPETTQEPTPEPTPEPVTLPSEDLEPIVTEEPETIDDNATQVGDLDVELDEVI